MILTPSKTNHQQYHHLVYESQARNGSDSSPTPPAVTSSSSPSNSDSSYSFQSAKTPHSTFRYNHHIYQQESHPNQYQLEFLMNNPHQQYTDLTAYAQTNYYQTNPSEFQQNFTASNQYQFYENSYYYPASMSQNLLIPNPYTNPQQYNQEYTNKTKKREFNHNDDSKSSSFSSAVSPASSTISSNESNYNKNKFNKRQSRISVFNSSNKKAKLDSSGKKTDFISEKDSDEEEEEEDDDQEELDEECISVNFNQTQLAPGEEPKKRVTANKKERRRTQSLNNAFSILRNRIPQIPADTKLSKIKTLRLAISYIEHLMKMVQENDPTSIEPFKPDLGKLRRECRSKEIKAEVERKTKGRTGWPSEVWSTELKKKLNDSNSNMQNSNANRQKQQITNYPNGFGALANKQQQHQSFYNSNNKKLNYFKNPLKYENT